VFFYGATLFLSAFLLFLVQPLLGKSILPWFGGVPAVWAVCLLFFQSLLLAGYCYSHVLATRLPMRKQALVHLVLLAVSLAALPILPSPMWKPVVDTHLLTVVDTHPLIRILGLLTVCVGAPTSCSHRPALCCRSGSPGTVRAPYPIAFIRCPTWIAPGHSFFTRC